MFTKAYNTSITLSAIMILDLLKSYGYRANDVLQYGIKAYIAKRNFKDLQAITLRKAIEYDKTEKKTLKLNPSIINWLRFNKFEISISEIIFIAFALLENEIKQELNDLYESEIEIKQKELQGIKNQQINAIELCEKNYNTINEYLLTLNN